MRSLYACVALFISFVVFVVPAQADTTGFSGYYAPANWTVAGAGTVNFTGAPDSAVITGGWAGESLTIVAPESGTVSFFYNFQDVGNTGPFVEFLIPFGTSTVEEIVIANSTSSGTYSFTVAQGDTFGIDIGDEGHGNGPYATISDFSAPPYVPEPCTLTLLGIGSLTMGLLRRRRV